MKKQQAIQLLGGTVSSAARKIGVSYQAIDRWPEELTAAIRDRVQAALYRDLIARMPELAANPSEQSGGAVGGGTLLPWPEASDTDAAEDGDWV